MAYRSIIQKVPVIYLAGGMKGNWQDLVASRVKGAILLDPRKSGQPAEHEYTAWDLAAVERCDAILGLMEESNPGGSGLAVEFGWGARAGKHLMLVEQSGFAQEKYFGMVRSLANTKEKATTLDEAVEKAVAMLSGYVAACRG